MEEVPRHSSRARPLHPLVSACFNRSGNKAAFRLPGVTWDRICCTVQPSPGHIRCRSSPVLQTLFLKLFGVALLTLRVAPMKGIL